MRFEVISGVISSNLKYISVVLLIPIVFAAIYGEISNSLPFLCASIIALLLGLLFSLPKATEKDFDNMKKTEALSSIFFSWVLFSLVCAVPYLFWGFSLTNACFEAVSGITTTGATTLVDFSMYPKTLFFYRAMTQWFGGMGIVILFIAVLPKFAIAGRQMFSAEFPGPVEEKITPRIKHTASWLWAMYLGLTLAEVVMLKLCGMDFYNAICNSMSTVSTGGFSPNPDSIMGYHSAKITLVVLVFTFLAGTNFILQYKTFIQRKWKDFLKSEEFFTYFGIFLIFTLAIFFILLSTTTGNSAKCLLDSAFQTISLMTSSGFASFDYIKWGADIKILLFAIMFVGGCAASTAGGLKVIRWIFIVKYIKREVAKIVHPSAVYPIRLEGRPVSADVGSQMVAFCAFYFFIFGLSAFVVALIEKSPTLALSGAIATLGNIGPALVSKLGPMANFADISIFTKWIFIFNMLVGRLELIPFLALLHKDSWTK